MLPRLRFVIAAALIAALPWILLSTGLVAPTPSERPYAGTGATVATGDLRDAHHMHALGFVRRSRELERLRELGSAPLAEWVASPTGIVASETSAAAGEAPPVPQQEAKVAEVPQPAPVQPVPAAVVEPAPTVIAKPALAVEAPVETAPVEKAEVPAANTEPPPAPATAAEPTTLQATVVASLPPESAPEIAAAPAPVSAPPQETTSLPETASAPDNASPPSLQGDATAAGVPDANPQLSNMDWSQVVPPLPRAKPRVERKKPVVRRARVTRTVPAPSPPPVERPTPDPFDIFARQPTTPLTGSTTRLGTAQ